MILWGAQKPVSNKEPFNGVAQIPIVGDRPFRILPGRQVSEQVAEFRSTSPSEDVSFFTSDMVISEDQGPVRR